MTRMARWLAVCQDPMQYRPLNENVQNWFPFFFGGGGGGSHTPGTNSVKNISLHL